MGRWQLATTSNHSRFGPLNEFAPSLNTHATTTPARPHRHIAILRRITVAVHRADKLFTQPSASRLDNTLDAEVRRLTGIDLLIVNDFALRASIMLLFIGAFAVTA